MTPIVPAARSARLPATFSVLVASHRPAGRATLGTGLTALGADPVHEAGSAGEALLCARTWGPCELAVVDLDLPDELGLPLVADLRARGWQRVVVLAGAGDHSAADAAFRLGAHGALLKPDTTGPDPGALVVTGPGPGNPPELPPPAQVLSATGTVTELSGREVQVLQLVADGRSNKDVGHQLGLSAATVKRHLTRISHKLTTGDRAQLVALAMRAGAVV